MQSYNEDYLEVWNMLAETAIYLLPKYRPEKSSWNTFYTNFAPRTVRKILKKINRYNLIETTYTDFNTPDNDILEDDDND